MKPILPDKQIEQIYSRIPKTSFLSVLLFVVQQKFKVPSISPLSRLCIPCWLHQASALPRVRCNIFGLYYVLPLSQPLQYPSLISL